MEGCENISAKKEQELKGFERRPKEGKLEYRSVAAGIASQRVLGASEMLQ